MSRFVLALDQGTTSCRSILFDRSGGVVAVSQQEIAQYFPQPGWVEHDAEEIWRKQEETMLDVLEKAQVEVTDVAAIGITNQRETVVVWDRDSGEPVSRALVWQDRRTAGVCQQLKDAGFESAVHTITGLKLDPYFSATKVQWVLDHVAGVRARAEAGELCLGTMDSWLVWKLTGGRRHVTDATNASRTLLCNIHVGAWDDGLVEKFSIPRVMLPEIVDSSGVVGEWRGVPIAGIAGDQQAALFGQGCFEPGAAKNTYGTGCFMLMHTGERVVRSQNQLLSTIALRRNGVLEYALEGSVFVAGALFQWLRDGLQIVSDVREIDQLAASVPDAGGVVIVPALAGLGAPHWDPDARGIIAGITRGTSKAHICRAALEAVCFQAMELLGCMERDAGARLTELRVDGGAARSDLLLQIQADLMGCAIVRPKVVETTAFGAAALAGLAVGFWPSLDAVAQTWQEDQRFEPRLTAAQREERRSAWLRAVERARS